MVNENIKILVVQEKFSRKLRVAKPDAIVTFVFGNLMGIVTMIIIVMI